MGILKKFLLIVLGVVASGAAVVYGSRYIPAGKLDGVKQVANQVQPFIASNIQQANVGQLAQYSGQLTSQVQQISGKVLGVQTTAKPEDASGAAVTATGSGQVNQSLPQKAFDFARYSYCQEVVKEYESRK